MLLFIKHSSLIFGTVLYVFPFLNSFFNKIELDILKKESKKMNVAILMINGQQNQQIPNLIIDKDLCAI